MLQGNVDVVGNVARTTNHLKKFLSHQSGVKIQHAQNSDPRQLIELTKESCKLRTMFGSQIHAIGTRVLRNKDELGRAGLYQLCLLYTSDAADDLLCVDLGGRRIIKKKKNK